jgi:hypothetical protein
MHVVIARPSSPPVPWVLVGATALGSIFMVLAPQFWALGVLVACFGLLWTVMTGNDLREPLEIDKIYLGFFGMYCVLPFVLAALNPDRLDTSILDPATVMCVSASMIGLMVGSRLSGASRLERFVARYDHPWRKREALIAGALLTLAGGALLALLFLQVGLSTYLSSQYVDSYAAETGKGYLSAGIFILRIGSLVLLLAALDYRKRLPLFPILLFLGVFLFYLRVGRRGVVLSGGLAVLIILHFHYRSLKYKTLITMACVGIVLFMAVAHARAYAAGGWDGMMVGLKDDFVLEDAWLSMQEINTVPMAIHEMTEYMPSQAPYLYGRSYWEAFQILIPLELYPDRPLGSAQWFAWYHDPRLAAKGGGFAFSLIAEGYINFGYFGAFLVGLVQGAFLKMLVQLRRNNPFSKSRLLVYACVGMQVFFLIRGDIGALMKLGLIVGLPTVAMAMFLGRHAQAEPPAAAMTVRG